MANVPCCPLNMRVDRFEALSEVGGKHRMPGGDRPTLLWSRSGRVFLGQGLSQSRKTKEAHTRISINAAIHLFGMPGWV
jgi:hypothetical protein